MVEPPSPPFDLERALARLAGRRSLLIYTHDNPDPDSLAAAMGLQRLAEHELGLVATLTYGGIVGRAQNRAMVENLKMPLTPVERIDLGQFDTIAVVDSQPETGNNSLPAGHRIDIVVDHHPPRPGSARAAWCDIRPDLGATSTIVFEYLRQRGDAGSGARIHRGGAARVPRAGAAGRPQPALSHDPPQGSARPLRGA